METEAKIAGRGRPTIGPGGRKGIATYCMLEPRYREALALLAERDARNLSNYLRRVVTQHIDEIAKEDLSVRAALGL
jgi:predicted DNA-binding protein